MYINTIIHNNIKKHKYTFIMLHPMYSDATYFNDHIDYFRKVNSSFLNFNITLKKSLKYK